MEQSKAPRKAAFTGRAALLFGAGTLSSRILGLIRDALLFSLMPLDMKDAWLAAFRLPNFFRRLLGEGGLSVSFIPVFVGLLSEDKKAERKELVDGVFTMLMAVVLLICLVGLLYMDPIVRFWLSGKGFASVPGKMEMTITMGRIMLLFLFFITLFAYFMALLNGLKKFTLSGFAPMMLNVAIVGGLWIYKDSPHLAEASSWAVVIGGFLQAVLLLPAVIREGTLPAITLRLKSPAIRRVMQKFAPTILGVGVLQVLAIVNVYFASQLDSGAVSYIYLGDRLLELPLSLIAVSIGTTLLPTLSGYWAQNDKELFTQCLSRHLSLFYFLAIPSAFGLWFLGVDIVDVLFSRGEFTAKEVPIVGGILKVYCLTLMAAGSLKILNQALYAAGDTLTPAMISCVGLGVHLVLAPRLMAEYGINGLVLSTSFISVISFFFSIWVLYKKRVSVSWRSVFKHSFKCAVAGGIMGVYLNYCAQGSWKFGRFLFDFPLLLLIVVGAALIYFGFAYLFKVEELALMRQKLKNRRKR